MDFFDRLGDLVDVRSQCSSSLKTMDPSKIPELLGCLLDTDNQSRTTKVTCCYLFELVAEEHYQAFAPFSHAVIGCLQSMDPALRKSASECIVSLCTVITKLDKSPTKPIGRVLKGLFSGIRSHDAEQQRICAESVNLVLAKCGSACLSHLERMCNRIGQCLSSSHLVAVAEVLNCLCTLVEVAGLQLQKYIQPIFPPILNALQHKSPNIRSSAAHAIEVIALELGDKAFTSQQQLHSILSILEQLQTDKASSVAETAKRAIDVCGAWLPPQWTQEDSEADELRALERQIDFLERTQLDIEDELVDFESIKDARLGSIQRRIDVLQPSLCLEPLSRE